MPERTVAVGLVADTSNYLAGMKAARGATNDLGQTVATTGEKSRVMAEKIGGGISKIGSTVGGEFGEVLQGVGEGIDSVASKAGKLAHGLEISGGVATTAGIGLLNLSSDLKQSTDLLSGAIENAGGSAEEYEKQIEGAVAAGQNLGHNAVEVKNALTTVVNATGDTAKSFKYMAVVTDLAASKHISLESAATQVAKILNGSGGKTLAQYGITMEKAYDNTNDLAKGHDRLLKAEQGVKNAQTQLTRLTEIDASKTKLTTTEKFRLADAHKKVKDAQALVVQETQQLNDLQGKSVTKTMAGKEAITQLAEKLDGQGAKSVDNFSSQVGIQVTKIKDWVDEVAGPLGSALAGLGPVLTIGGIAVDVYRTKQEAAALATAQMATSAVLAKDAEVGLTATTVGLDAVMDANPIGLVALALGGLAAVITPEIIGNQKDLTQATRDYTAALAADNGELGINVRKRATQDLLDSGALLAAKKIGIPAGLLVDDILGVAGAHAKLKAKLDESKQALDDSSKAIEKHGAFGQKSGLQLNEYSKNIKKVETATDDETDALQGTLKKQKLYDAAYSDLGNTALTTAGDIGRINEQLRSLPKSVAEISFSVSTHEAKRARGGVVQPGETTLVGEEGPEYVRLPAGSRVYPHGTGPSYAHMSAAPQSSGTASTLVINNHINAGMISDKNQLAREITDTIKNGLRSGSVSAGWNSGN